ncbi:hypothetical protein OQA88_10225 [Cercophora sp. LCS_1]
MVQICFQNATRIAYTQHFWRAMPNVAGLDELDGAHAADGAPLQLLFIWRQRTLVALAAACYLVRIAAILAPATLAVVPTMLTRLAPAEVPCLDIQNIKGGSRFASSPPVRNDTIRNVNDTDVDRVFTGPRTIVQLIVAQTSTSGHTLFIEPQYIRSEYSLQFHGPYIQCQDANSTAREITQELIQRRIDRIQGSIKEVLISAYIFVPLFDESGRISALDKPRVQLPTNATNELWMMFMRSQMAENGTMISAERHYTVCRLHDALYDITLKFDNGVQTVVKNNLTIMGNPVSYPDYNSNNTDMVQHAYSAVMWAISDSLVGSLSLSEDQSTGVKLGYIDTRIAHTTLLGSDDLDYFFYTNTRNLHPLDDNHWLGKQRLQDKNFARNLTLPFLIEELSFNVTVGFPSNLLLSAPVMTNITVHETVNVYAYNASILWGVYGSATFLTLVSVISGLTLYMKEGNSTTRDVSAVLAAVIGVKADELWEIIRRRHQTVALEPQRYQEVPGDDGADG